MAFKLTIGDVMDVRIKGAVQGDAGSVPFNFTLRMRRIGIAAYRQVIRADSDVLIKDFLAANTVGWAGQRLVLDEADQPAAFSPEAFEALLTVVGMEGVIYQAYDQALTAAATPQGRAAN